MKFSVPRNQIYEAVQKVIGTVPSKTTTPIIYDILLELSGNELRLTATDLEVLASTTLSVMGSEDGTIAIPAKFLNDILRELSNVELNFSLEEGFRVRLQTSTGEYLLVGDPGEDFPLMPEQNIIGTITVSQKKLKRMIGKTVFAVSQDEMRKALMGVYFELYSNEFRMVGTDGHRLSRIIDKEFSFEGEESFIVPTKALLLLDKTLDSSDKPVTIQFSENYVSFQVENMTVFSRLVDSQYPKYEEVIPIHNNKTLLVDKDILLGSLKRVSIFSSLATRQVRLDIFSDYMEVSSQDLDIGGEGREKVAVEYNAEPMSIAFNSEYFISVLKHIDTEKVKILMDGSLVAVLIFPEEQLPAEEFMLILMPVRLPEEEVGEEELSGEDEENSSFTIDEETY